MGQRQAQSFVASPGNMKKTPALFLKSDFPVVNGTGDESQTVIGEQLRDGYATVHCRPGSAHAIRARHLLITHDRKRLALVVGI
jgi:hypothetical protein